MSMQPAKITVAKAIAEQLHRMLDTKKQQAELLKHNLEKGLGNEQALRDLLAWFLPRRFGIGKGKIVNSQGEMSRQLDIIIYDALQCPTLFIDENENQIVPIEGVYGVIEVKTTLTASTLKDAFDNLQTVYSLKTRRNVSTNDFLILCPPSLQVFGFSDQRSLNVIANQFNDLSSSFIVERSYSSYSKKSPGFKEHTGRQFLIGSVDVLGKGCVLHMLDGKIETYDWGEYTLSMFIMGIVEDFDEVKLPRVDLNNYLNWIMVDQWRGTGKIQERLQREKKVPKLQQTMIDKKLAR
jgi:hypothetical protein